MMATWKAFVCCTCYWVSAALLTHWIPWDIVLASGVISGTLHAAMMYRTRRRRFPHPCGLCPGVIESGEDLDWHGLGNCVGICPKCFGGGHTGAKGLADSESAV